MYKPFSLLLLVSAMFYTVCGTTLADENTRTRLSRRPVDKRTYNLASLVPQYTYDIVLGNTASRGWSAPVSYVLPLLKEKIKRKIGSEQYSEQYNEDVEKEIGRIFRNYLQTDNGMLSATKGRVYVLVKQVSSEESPKTIKQRKSRTKVRGGISTRTNPNWGYRTRITTDPSTGYRTIHHYPTRDIYGGALKRAKKPTRDTYAGSREEAKLEWEAGIFERHNRRERIRRKEYWDFIEAAISVGADLKGLPPYSP